MQADPPLQQIDSRDQVEPGSAAYYLWMIYEAGRANYKSYWHARGPVDSRGVAAVFHDLAKQADRGLEALGFAVPERL